jgi:membrane protein DedA with SNARE-associated domain
MFEAFDHWIRSVGPLAYLGLFIASLVEYLFPPFPGDVLVVLGGVYAVRGEKPWVLVFLVVTSGSILGAYLNFLFGKWLAKGIPNWPEHKRRFGIRRHQLEDLQHRMQKYGDLLLIGNRFLPGIRSLLFVAAGASDLKLSRVLVLGGVSAVAWNLALVSLGVAVGGRAERIFELMRVYQQGVVVLMAVAAAAVMVRLFARNRRKVRGES